MRSIVWWEQFVSCSAISLVLSGCVLWMMLMSLSVVAESRLYERMFKEAYPVCAVGRDMSPTLLTVTTVI